jgi:hypothetical protein
LATVLRLSIWGDLSPQSSNAIGAFCFLSVAVFCLRPLSLPDSLHGFPLRSSAHNAAHLALFAAGILSVFALVDAFVRSVARALRVDELGMRDAFLEIAAWVSPVAKVPPRPPPRLRIARAVLRIARAVLRIARAVLRIARAVLRPTSLTRA